MSVLNERSINETEIDLHEIELFASELKRLIQHHLYAAYPLEHASIVKQICPDLFEGDLCHCYEHHLGDMIQYLVFNNNMSDYHPRFHFDLQSVTNIAIPIGGIKTTKMCAKWFLFHVSIWNQIEQYMEANHFILNQTIFTNICNKLTNLDVNQPAPYRIIEQHFGEVLNLPVGWGHFVINCLPSIKFAYMHQTVFYHLYLDRRCHTST